MMSSVVEMVRGEVKEGRTTRNTLSVDEGRKDIDQSTPQNLGALFEVRVYFSPFARL